MKVYIYFSSSPLLMSFEGSRLRKNLKGMCESAHVTWVDSPFSSPDVSHFIAPRDIKRLLKAKQAGSKTVVSAFYCEHDPEARMLFVGEDGSKRLKKKAAKFLNAADLVLVPAEKAREFCKENGITSRIEVLEPTINSYLFSETEIEKSAGLRYFGIRDGEKVCVALGSFSNKTSLDKFFDLAKRLPKMRFFYFGPRMHRVSPAYFFASLRAPKNCQVQTLDSGDLFRSLLTASLCYAIVDPAPDMTAALEAFACSSQVVVIGENAVSDLFADLNPCAEFKTVGEAAAYIDALYNGKANESIIAASRLARSFTTARQADKLIGYYKSLFQKEN